jgi:hypothetical protein
LKQNTGDCVAARPDAAGFAFFTPDLRVFGPMPALHKHNESHACGMLKLEIEKMGFPQQKLTRSQEA